MMKQLYNNYWSQQTKTEYINSKIDTILNDIHTFMVNHNYLLIDMDYKTGQIKFDDYSNIKNLIIHIYNNLQLVDFSDIDYFDIGTFDHDDFYVLMLFDDDKQLKYKLFWNFDFEIYQNHTCYDFMDNFNVFEWL